MALTASLLSLLAPPTCLACGGSVTVSAAPLCPGCASRLPWLRGPRCPRCALPRHRASGCPAAAAAFDRAWAPLAHGGVARDVVAALKVRASPAAARLMAAQLAAGLPRDLLAPGAVLVAVPPQPSRRRRRGYDPARMLAVALARRKGVPASACLARVDRSGRQAGTGRAARRAARIEIVAAGPPPELALLVDDVHTTGATLEACARVLRAGGCARVVAVTYTRAL